MTKHNCLNFDKSYDNLFEEELTKRLENTFLKFHRMDPSISLFYYSKRCVYL